MFIRVILTLLFLTISHAQAYERSNNHIHNLINEASSTWNIIPQTLQTFEKQSNEHQILQNQIDLYQGYLATASNFIQSCHSLIQIVDHMINAPYSVHINTIQSPWCDNLNRLIRCCEILKWVFPSMRLYNRFSFDLMDIDEESIVKPWHFQWHQLYQINFQDKVSLRVILQQLQSATSSCYIHFNYEQHYLDHVRRLQNLKKSEMSSEEHKLKNYLAKQHQIISQIEYSLKFRQ